MQTFCHDFRLVEISYLLADEGASLAAEVGNGL